MSRSSAVIVHDRTPEQTVRAARAVAETATGLAIAHAARSLFLTT